MTFPRTPRAPRALFTSRPRALGVVRMCTDSGLSPPTMEGHFRMTRRRTWETGFRDIRGQGRAIQSRDIQRLPGSQRMSSRSSESMNNEHSSPPSKAKAASLLCANFQLRTLDGRHRQAVTLVMKFPKDDRRTVVTCLTAAAPAAAANSGGWCYNGRLQAHSGGRLAARHCIVDGSGINQVFREVTHAIQTASSERAPQLFPCTAGLSDRLCDYGCRPGWHAVVQNGAVWSRRSGN